MDMYSLTKENFELFYMDHFDEFLAFTLTRVGDKNIAIDICQECFIKTLEQVYKDSVIESPRGYFYKILRNKIIDFYRKKKSASLDDFINDGGDIAENNLEGDNHYYLLIIEKLKELPDNYRDIIIMKMVMDLSISDISERTGLSENVISVRIHRGREIAQKLLADLVY